MKNDLIRIILVDDNKLVRESWKILLENNPRFKVIADCDNGQIAIEQAKKLIPDIMLVDINMTPIDGYAVTERILNTSPAIKIIGLSVYNQAKYALRMVKLGASGFLTKTSSLKEITQGIIEVYNGNSYICEEVKKNMPPAK